VTVVLEMASVSRRFGGLVAVDAVDVAVQEGEIRGLIGPNGAGKTTLLNLIGGQVSVSSGRIRLDGVEIADLRPDRRTALGIRRTFQNLKLFRDMTVLENVMVGLHTKTRSEILRAIMRSPGQRREEAWMAEEAPASSPWSACRPTPVCRRRRWPMVIAGCWRLPEQSSPSRACCCSTSPRRD
jgi:branched-chain amino acid transport system ATP-binding protein